MEDVVIIPNLASRWPTVESVMTAPFDCGRLIGLAVKFKHSGLRFAIKGESLDTILPEMDAYIADAPYGRNRHGKPWELRS